MEHRFGGETPYLVFRYRIVRMWALPVEMLLSGGLGLVPLAPLGAVTEADLPRVVRRMQMRINQEARPEEAGTLWTAADVLMGLRYSRDLVSELLRGVRGMKDSVTYQAIVEEGVEKGRLEEARTVLLDLGAERFGAPGEEVEAAIARLDDLTHLRRLHRRLLHASSWRELLSEP
ncbi:MAG: hypothetical protein HUU20_22895 [Pirellulales bacterium]|nr:hypothetical protein [Pirellulales bacterium]